MARFLLSSVGGDSTYGAGTEARALFFCIVGKNASETGCFSPKSTTFSACGEGKCILAVFFLVFLPKIISSFLWVVNKKRILSAFVGKVERGWREKSEKGMHFQM